MVEQAQTTGLAAHVQRQHLARNGSGRVRPGSRALGHTLGQSSALARYLHLKAPGPAAARLAASSDPGAITCGRRPCTACITASLRAIQRAAFSAIIGRAEPVLLPLVMVRQRLPASATDAARRSRRAGCRQCGCDGQRGRHRGPSRGARCPPGGRWWCRSRRRQARVRSRKSLCWYWAPGRNSSGR